MCGIAALVYGDDAAAPADATRAVLEFATRCGLERRGPDGLDAAVPAPRVALAASVLRMRRTDDWRQPVVDGRGNALAWNGEWFDGDGAPAAGDVEAPGGGADGARATTTATLLVVAFCGSLDDLTLFVPMLAGGAIGPLALLAGAAAATALIVAICVFLNFFRAISDRLAAVPLVCVTSAFATFLIAKVALMR